MALAPQSASVSYRVHADGAAIVVCEDPTVQFHVEAYKGPPPPHVVRSCLGVDGDPLALCACR